MTTRGYIKAPSSLRDRSSAIPKVAALPTPRNEFKPVHPSKLKMPRVHRFTALQRKVFREQDEFREPAGAFESKVAI